MKKRFNQTDSTLRNVRAANTRINAVAKRMNRLQARVDAMAGTLTRLRPIVARLARQR